MATVTKARNGKPAKAKATRPLPTPKPQPSAPSAPGAYCMKRLETVIPDLKQYRKVGDVTELMHSILEHGMMSPIEVTPADGDGNYHIIIGHRRHAAALEAGLKFVPCIVRDDRPTPADVAMRRLVENLQRQDANPIENALEFKRLMDSEDLTQKALAGSLGITEQRLSKALCLLKLPLNAQVMIAEGKMSAAVGYAISMSCKSLGDMAAMASTAIEHGWSRDEVVRQGKLIEECYPLNGQAALPIADPGKISPGDSPPPLVNGKYVNKTKAETDAEWNARLDNAEGVRTLPIPQPPAQSDQGKAMVKHVLPNGSPVYVPQKWVDEQAKDSPLANAWSAGTDGTYHFEQTDGTSYAEVTLHAGSGPSDLIEILGEMLSEAGRLLPRLKDATVLLARPNSETSSHECRICGFTPAELAETDCHWIETDLCSDPACVALAELPAHLHYRKQLAAINAWRLEPISVLKLPKDIAEACAERAIDTVGDACETNALAVLGLPSDWIARIGGDVRWFLNRRLDPEKALTQELANALVNRLSEGTWLDAWRSGRTDEELTEMVVKVFSETKGSTAAQGRLGHTREVKRGVPQFWVPIREGRSNATLEGAGLVAKAREVMQIPYPKPKS